VRTYYPRTYEVTYLLGMLAGIMTKTGHIGYVAANPVYGVPAAINAFAQGMKSVRPAGRIWLRWACQTDAAHPLDFADCPEIDMVYARDSREPADTNRDRMSVPQAAGRQPAAAGAADLAVGVPSMWRSCALSLTAAGTTQPPPVR